MKKIDAYVWPHGGFIQCNENCPYDSECANHHTAGDFRTEGGFAPTIEIKNGEAFCDTVENGFKHEKFGALTISDFPEGSDIKDSFELHLEHCAMCRGDEKKEYDPIKELINALQTMLVAVDESTPEEFPGHHKAYLNTVAIPRAKKAIEETEKWQREQKT